MVTPTLKESLYVGFYRDVIYLLHLSQIMLQVEPIRKDRIEAEPSGATQLSFQAAISEIVNSLIT